MIPDISVLSSASGYCTSYPILHDIIVFNKRTLLVASVGLQKKEKLFYSPKDTYKYGKVVCNEINIRYR